MKKKSIKLPYLISLVVMLLTLNNLNSYARENANYQLAMDRGLDIVKEFDYYEIKTPEDYNNIGKQFKQVSKECLNNKDGRDKQQLDNILRECFEVLNKDSIDMLEVNNKFEQLKTFCEDNAKSQNRQIKRSEVIEIIEENLGTTEGIIVGYQDNSVKENRNITKAELGTIIYRIMSKYDINKIENNRKVTIKQASNHWSEEFISNEFIADMLNLKIDSNINEFVTYKELQSLKIYLNTFI